MQSAMHACPWKLSPYRTPTNSLPRTFTPSLGYVIQYSRYSTFGSSLQKNMCPCIRVPFSSFLGPCSCSPVQKDINQVETSHVNKGLAQSNLTEAPILTENIQLKKRPILKNSENEDDTKTLRRKKIGHRNKGKVPWNKGRKHSEETREKIRLRTREALKDPKVRKKMSECPRSLSNETKAKIRTSLTKLWSKRLKWKRSRERFLQSWAESIANAARIGGSDQQELDWDSYDKIKQEIALLHINQTAEKAKVKEMARIRAERSAQIRAERLASISQKIKEREETAKVRGGSTRKRNKKSKEEKEKLAESQEIKLKERLMKIHKKKSTIQQVSNQHRRSWEKFDFDIVKGEQLQKEISLADQIRFAKNRRTEQLLDKL